VPTYDYVCDACQHAFDHFQSMSSEHLRKCPACGKRKLRRLIGSGAGVIFKGGGFYETDYKKGRTSKGHDAADDGGSSSKSDLAPSKGDAKPAETAASTSSDSKPSDAQASDAKRSGDGASKPAAAKDSSSKSDGAARRGGKDKSGGETSQ
jgi:putative FmdB family regulatory protein